MRLMEVIRRKGHWFLITFLVIFTITLFFGLTGGFSGGIFAPPGGRGPNSGKVEKAAVLTTEQGADTALLVNGRKVSNNVYDQVVDYMTERIGTSDDPTIKLSAYGYAVTMLTGQEVLMAYGEEHGIKLSNEDWAKAKSDAAQPFMDASAAQQKQGGNIVGDAFGKLGKLKQEKVAFDKYLQTVGKTESQWQEETQRSIYTNKVRDSITDELNKTKADEIEKVKGKVDADLKAGKDFQEVAKQYSEGQTKDKGGEIDWVGRGLLAKDVTDKLFAVKKGEISEWIKVPIGWQKFQVYDKVEATGPEWDKKKAELTQQIRDEKKDQKYNPSDEELKDKYEKVRARVIELHDKDDMKATQHIQELIDAAKVEINNPYALAFQAYKDSKLQPVATLSRDKLIEIAKLAPLGDNYDFSVLDKKLAAGKPKGAKADETKDAAAGDSKPGDAKSGETKPGESPDTSGAAKMTDSASTDEAKPELVTTPIYALTYGLLSKATQDSNSTQDSWPYFIEARVLTDWLKDDKEAVKQPVNTKIAREQLEKLLAQVVKSNNYSGSAHAMRGLNLARLDQKKEAADELALAEKYAPSDMSDVWTTIREGYKVLDDTAKLAELDKKIQELQQKQFQEMIQRQLQQQGAGGQSVPIQVQ